MADRTITINGVLYRVPETWKQGDGPPIFERVGGGVSVVPLPDDENLAAGLPSWVWMVGAAFAFFFMFGGGKGRR